MALFDLETPCPLCGSPIGTQDDFVAFTYLGSYDALVEILDDGVVQRRCLSKWDRRDEFVAAWNAEARGRLGEQHVLEITPEGEVWYKHDRSGRPQRSIMASTDSGSVGSGRPSGRML